MIMTLIECLARPTHHLRAIRPALAVAALSAMTVLAVPAVQAQTLTVGVRAGPFSMDPHFSNIGPHAEAMKNIYETLVWAGNDLSLEPRLATSWEPIDDTTWEFKLRQGVKFHDGSDFTAEDVLFSIERIPGASGPSTPTTQNIRRVVDAVAVDDYTVRITTDGPAPTLPNDFNRVFIVSADAAKDYSTRDTADEGFNSGKAAVGTGPYKFGSFTPKNSVVLSRFDEYWGGPSSWEEIIFKEVPNDSARVAQLKAGQLDLIVRVPAADVATLERDPKIKVVTGNTIYIFTMEFDLHDQTPHVTAKDGSPIEGNPFLDPRVREAFSLAIDREAMVEIAMEGLGAPAKEFVPPSIFGYNASLPELPTDIDRARELMAEAGFPDGFKVEMAFTNDRLPGDRQVGVTLAQMLARIGVEVEAQPMPIATFFPARNNGEFSLAMMGMGSPTGEAQAGLNAFLRTREPEKGLGTFSIAGYSNPELDNLIDGAATELDEAKRKAMLEDALAIVAEDRPVVSIAIIGSAWAMHADKVDFLPRADEDTIAENIIPVGTDAK